MKKNVLLRTNLLVCAVIVLGFIATTIVGYSSNQKIFHKDVENVTALTSEGIFHQIDSLFTKPIHISMTMANDSLLESFLNNEVERQEDADFLEEMRAYLDGYHQKYDYDSVFLASAQTKRYYNFNGFDRMLTEGDPENEWFYDFLNRDDEYTIKIDNDEVEGAANEVTVFINCRIRDGSGVTVGVVGVGFRVNSMQSLLKGYEELFGVSACLINEAGNVEISTERTGFEGTVNLFDVSEFTELRDRILEEREGASASWYSSPSSSGYVVSQYVSNLKWYLVVVKDTTALDQQLVGQIWREALVLSIVIVLVLLTITSVIRRYNAQIIELTLASEKKHQTVFQKATEQLYENIYEIDITHNRAASEETEDYFASLGAQKKCPYDKALHAIAEKQIKEEYRQGYIDTFSPEHVLKAYENGTKNLRYEFMISNDGETYYWMRITAHIFFWSEDHSVRMLVYRENIDKEKQRELFFYDEMQKDSLTRLFNKVATQDHIRAALAQYPEKMFGFFILDIDTFKGVNDRLGHAAGDAVLIEFARLLQTQFDESGIVGRIGGDEFVAFLPVGDRAAAEKKAKELLNVLCGDVRTDAGVVRLTASIGIALSPEAGTEFETLYEKADFALYQTKRRGRDGFTLYQPPAP